VLSIIIPAWNEADNLALLLPQLREILADLGGESEILVADNDSPDATAAICRREGVRCLSVGGPGYGRALRAGFAAARGEYLLTMDADLSHPAAFIRTLWEHRSRADVVIASRYLREGEADMPPLRLFLSRLLNWSFRKALDVSIRDLSSGFRLYRREVIQEVAPTGRDFNVLQEILFKAYSKGFRVLEVPFHYHRRESGRSHARLLAFGVHYIRTFWSMWRLRNSIASGDYDRRAFDSRIPLQRWWQRRRHKIIVAWANGGGPALDIGCGSSRILDGLPPGSLGVDPSLASLRYARLSGRLVVAGALPRIPVRDGRFPTVVCSQVIEHIPRDAENFDEFSRLVAPGGILIVGTPDYARLAWRLTEWCYRHLIPGGYADEHITHYTRDSLQSELRQRGFRVLEERYVGGGELILRCRKE